MKTPSHAIVGFVAAKAFGLNRQQLTACIAGACLADLPLMAAYGYFWLKCFWQTGHYDATYIKSLMDAVYFEQGWLLVAHNLFHSPVSIGYLALVCLICCKLNSTFCKLILAYLLGSFSHSLLDIISHINDGPLLIWPLNDNFRFIGMFSHYYMGLPMYIELASIAALAVLWLRNRVDMS